MQDKKLTEINDKEHGHPFFGFRLNEHKKTFNKLVTDGIPKKYPSCQHLFWNYREKIISTLNKESILDRWMEGYECGMSYSSPSEDDCSKVEQEKLLLDQLQETLTSCIKG